MEISNCIGAPSYGFHVHSLPIDVGGDDLQCGVPPCNTLWSRNHPCAIDALSSSYE